VRADDHGLVWAGGPGQLDRLCAESDVLLVSVPLADDTRGAIGPSELEALGPNAIMINVARGPVVQEQALYDALRTQRLGAAAIDVWYNYPTPGNATQPPASMPFGELDNVLMTPHVSGVAESTFTARVTDIAANLLAVRDGSPLRNQISRG
jgi:phosphoglycerate dehydrogenase-like enzyme